MTWKIVLPVVGGLVLLVTIIIVATVPEPPVKIYIPPAVKRVLEAINDTETRILAEFDDAEKFCPVFSTNPAHYNLVNIAFEKDTMGSPIYQNNKGMRHHLAVDCNSKTIYHSVREQYPWWSVDLGTEYLIQAIRILPSQTTWAHWSSFKDIKVSIGTERPVNRDLSGYTQVGTYVGPYNLIEGWVEFNLDMKISGRYVDIARTTITNDDYIILAEVEVLVDRRDLPGHIPHSECERRIDELTKKFLESRSEIKQQIEELINMVDILMKSSTESACVAPFGIIPGVGCLYQHPDGGTWEDGKVACEYLGSSLFVANSTEQFLTLKRFFASHRPPNADIWVGMRNGVWLSGRVPASEEWVNGFPGQRWGSCGHIVAWAKDRSPTYALKNYKCNGHARPLCQRDVI